MLPLLKCFGKRDRSHPDPITGHQERLLVRGGISRDDVGPRLLQQELLDDDVAVARLRDAAVAQQHSALQLKQLVLKVGLLVKPTGGGPVAARPVDARPPLVVAPMPVFDAGAEAAPIDSGVLALERGEGDAGGDDDAPAPSIGPELGVVGRELLATHGDEARQLRPFLLGVEAGQDPIRRQRLRVELQCLARQLRRRLGIAIGPRQRRHPQAGRDRLGVLLDDLGVERSRRVALARSLEQEPEIVGGQIEGGVFVVE
jgi:hypothetical protein